MASGRSKAAQLVQHNLVSSRSDFLKKLIVGDMIAFRPSLKHGSANPSKTGVHRQPRPLQPKMIPDKTIPDK